ncbi:MAG: hypothetical protein JWO59_1030, partial [Chloroflexi bacterium]|nr:hypothetical protein [Chloroflexota bacterium]
MSVQPWHATVRSLRRLGSTAALLTVSLAPPGPAHAGPGGFADAATNGAPYTLSLSALQRLGDTSVPDLLGTGVSSIRVMACLHPDPPISIHLGGPALSRPLIHGGDTLLLRADALPPHRTFALLFDIPRVHSSANVRVPIRYSPPAVTAVSDADGKLVDLQGNPGLHVVVPGDASSGAGTLRLLEQGSSWQRVQTLPMLPQPPAVEIRARDATGQPVPDAVVRFEGAGRIRCAARTDAHGNLLLTHAPAGTASVSVLRGAEVLGVFHPYLAAGQTVVLAAVPGPKSGPVVVTAHSSLNCDKKTGYTYALRDSASGLPTATSGDGPFGVFIAGIATADTFTAQLTSKAASGSLGPIAHDTAIAVGVITVDNTTVPIPSKVGSDVPGGGPSGTAGYTNLTFRLDVGALPAGKNYIQINVGAPSSYCTLLSEVDVASNPTDTPLGTVDSYFDPATTSYQIDGVLPTHPKLKFHEPLDFSLPSQSLGAAQLPAADFQNWNNEGQIGLEVHETVRTDGSWSGTVGGHARLILFNYTLVNKDLPLLQGSGPNLRTGSMARTVRLVGKTIDTSLYNYLVAVPELGIILVVNLRFDASGNVDVKVEVPPTLDQAAFTIDPSVTGSIIGSATLPTPFGTFSAELSGDVGLAAPVTLRVPGGPAVHVGMLISATAKFGSPLGSPAPLKILPLQCIGSCGPAGQSVRIASSKVVANMLQGNTAPAWSSESRSSPKRAVDRAVPVNLSVQAGKTAPDAQPATALAPDGTPATLWISTRRDGTQALRSQVGHALPRTIVTNGVALATPQITWIGPHRALAVWMASTAAPLDVVRLQSALPNARNELMRALFARQQLFSSQWDGSAWSAPEMITDGMALNAEPSLAGDAATGQAVLAWVRGPRASIQPGSLSGLTIASMRFDGGAWSAPATVSTTGQGAVNAPSVALGPQGNAGVAWLEGPLGTGRAMVSQIGTAGWTAPATIAGLSSSAQRIALAFDAQG